MIDRLRRTFIQYRQFLLYAIIGASGVTIDLATFFVLFNVVGIHESLATAISTSLGIVNNFAWNRHFNFRVHDQWFRRFLRFYAVGLSGIVLTVGMFHVFATWMGVSPNLVKVASLLPVLVLQYTLNKLWTFGIDGPATVPTPLRLATEERAPLERVGSGY